MRGIQRTRRRKSSLYALLTELAGERFALDSIHRHNVSIEWSRCVEMLSGDALKDVDIVHGVSACRRLRRDTFARVQAA